MHKDEKQILHIIDREKDIYFNDLLKLCDKRPNDLDEILDILAIQSKIKIKRELIEASWTKHITSIEEIEVEIDEIKINKNQKDYIWTMFSRQPCFICPFRNKCNDTNMDQFNPLQCPWLTEWVEINLAGKDYDINFDEIKANLKDI